MKIQLDFERRHLIQAQRLNKLLRLLPRYHTDRRWNAKLANLLIRTTQFTNIDRLFSRRRVFERVVEYDGRRIKLRFSMPSGAPRAVYVHFHGGAWVLGNARLDDGLASKLAEDCQILVAAVDFHNALDDRLDVTIDDCEAALEWVARNLPALGVEQILVGGESSGAHLAAQSLLRLRDKKLGAAFCGLVSVCGAFDLEGSRSLKRASDETLIVSGPSAYRNLTRLRPSVTSLEARGPLHAELHALPPALFVAGELDPILDDSIEMYRRWQQTNGNATLCIIPSAPHGFHRLPTAIARSTNGFIHRWALKKLASCPPNANG